MEGRFGFLHRGTDSVRQTLYFEKVRAAGAGAWLVRLFGASGEEKTAKSHWSTPAPRQMCLSDLSEAPIQRIGDEMAVAGWNLVTLRVDRP
jgi:hypothetical protein